MFCRICGSKMEDGTKFCMNCGSPLDDPKMQPNPAPQAQAPVQPQSQPAPQAAPAAKVQASGTEGLDPEVEDFLDAKSSADRLHILASLNHRLTDEMLITMATACDVELPEGDVRTKYLSLRESLLILGKYEGDRLRK